MWRHILCIFLMSFSKSCVLYLSVHSEQDLTRPKVGNCVHHCLTFMSIIIARFSLADIMRIKKSVNVGWRFWRLFWHNVGAYSTAVSAWIVLSVVNIVSWFIVLFILCRWCGTLCTGFRQVAGRTQAFWRHSKHHGTAHFVGKDKITEHWLWSSTSISLRRWTPRGSHR